MAKDLNLVWLLDCYRGLLTARQQEAMAFYYEEDLSLSEMAEAMDITRQAAHDLLQRSTTQLQEWETQIGMVRRYREADAFLEGLQTALIDETTPRAVLLDMAQQFIARWKTE